MSFDPDNELSVSVSLDSKITEEIEEDGDVAFVSYTPARRN